VSVPVFQHFATSSNHAENMCVVTFRALRDDLFFAHEFANLATPWAVGAATFTSAHDPCPSTPTNCKTPDAEGLSPPPSSAALAYQHHAPPLIDLRCRREGELCG